MISFAQQSGRRSALETTKTRLAHEPDRVLGALTVRPSRGIVRDGAAEYRVRPQLMQALLVLLGAEGRTVTRDALVDACWDGRIVSDDAISRLIAQLRALARSFEPPPFQLETIPKIGFRLEVASADTRRGRPPVDRPPSPAPPPAAGIVSRRRVLVAGAGVAALGGGAVWLTAMRRPPAPVRAAMERGRAAFRQMTPDQTAQAIAAFDEATALAPRHAEGWAWLALACWEQSRSGALGDTGRALAQRAGAAANRALALEPGNAEAEAALAALRPTTTWVATAAAMSALLARHPRNFSANSVAMNFYASSGQLELALRCAQAAMRADAGWPKLYMSLSVNLWATGRLNEADAWITRGISQWPRHASLWFARQRLLAYSGRAAEALAMIDDVDQRPLGIPAWDFDLCRQESRALLTGAPADVAATANRYRGLVSRLGFALNDMQFLSAVGRLDEAFALLNTLYFGRATRLGPTHYSAEQGRYSPPDRRDTWFLWQPQLAAMRADRRMTAVVRRIGLAEYWRVTGSRPATPIAGI